MTKLNFKIATSNPFDDQANEFFNSSKAEHLYKKFTPKPFEVRYKLAYWIACFVSLLCNVLSIITASTFVFFWLHGLLFNIPLSYLIAIVFTVTFLGIIEVLQRTFAPGIYQNYYQYKKLSYGLIIACYCLTSISCYLSYKGSKNVAFELSTAPTPKAAILVNVDSIKNKYQNLILDAKKDATSFYNSALYLGKLSSKDRKTYNNLLQRKESLQTALISELDKAGQQNESIKTATKEANNHQQKEYLQTTEQTGINLAYITIFAILVFYLCEWFKLHYDWKTLVQYATIENSSRTPKQVKAPAPKKLNGKAPALPVNQIGFKHYSNTTKIVNDTKQRICKYCKEPYQYRHHKQKYCKDECRIAAWELRTGKTLNRHKRGG